MTWTRLGPETEIDNSFCVKSLHIGDKPSECNTKSNTISKSSCRTLIYRLIACTEGYLLFRGLMGRTKDTKETTYAN